MYLKEFVIGSSYPVSLLFFLVVMNISDKNYSYESYTLIAPVYLGLMNVLSAYLQNKFDLTLRERFYLIGIISPVIIVLFAYFYKAYPFTTTKQWLTYAIRLIIKHFLIFNLIVYNLEVFI